MVTPEEMTTYLNAMFDRREQSQFVAFLDVTFQDGSKPAIARCHANVDRWVRENPCYETAQGWLIIGSNDYLGLFGSHSVVRTPGRRLADIAPVEPGQPRVRFLEHAGTRESYEPFLEAQFAYFTWPQGIVSAMERGAK